MVASLRDAGPALEAMTNVVFTHAHSDHQFGAVTAVAPVFANATYHIGENELTFWTQPALADMMPKDLVPMVMGIQGALDVLRDKTTAFKIGAEVLPGIMALDTPGHTTGHVSFDFPGRGWLALVGDAIAVPGVFFAKPEWKFGFDAYFDMAGKTRRRLLDMAAQGKRKLLGYHWAYPGFGMAEVKDSAFVHVPAV